MKTFAYILGFEAEPNSENPFLYGTLDWDQWYNGHKDAHGIVIRFDPINYEAVKAMREFYGENNVGFIESEIFIRIKPDEC